MKLIMENWRNFLAERELGDTIHGPAAAAMKYAKKKRALSPREEALGMVTRHVNLIAHQATAADLKDIIAFLVRSYNKNEAIRKVITTISSNELKKIDKAVKTIKDISKLKDAKEIQWKFTDACKTGMFGGESCVLGSVVAKYNHLENTSRVLQFNMFSRPEKGLRKLIHHIMLKLGPFIKLPKKRNDQGFRELGTIIRNFDKFVEVMLSIEYSCTYVHEAYHYYEFSKDSKHDTEEWKMMKNLGYRPPTQANLPDKFIGASSRTTSPSAELRSIQVEEDYLKVLESSLPVHIKKTEKFPGYVGSWSENPKDESLIAALDELFEYIFAGARGQIAAYRMKQHRELFTLFNNMYGWKQVGGDVKKPKSGPYARKNQKYPKSDLPQFTSTGQIRGRDGKAITGPAPKLPRIKRRGDPRSD